MTRFAGRNTPEDRLSRLVRVKTVRGSKRGSPSHPDSLIR
jgi:hypothetical protein